MTFSKPALYIYSLGSKDSRLGDRQRKDEVYFRQLWAACCTLPQGLKMSEPYRWLSPNRDFPKAFGPTRHSLQIVAAAKRQPTPTAVEMSYVFEYLDAAGICVCIGPNDDKRRWSSLYEEWKEARGTTSGHKPTLGEALVFQGTYIPGESPPAAAELRQSVNSSLPEDCRAEHHLNLAYTTPEGLYLWEAGPVAERRVLVFLTPAGDEEDQAAGQWLFWQSPQTLALLPRFLLHSGKLDYLSGVFRGEAPKLRERADQTDSKLKTILALHRQFDRSGNFTGEALLEAQKELSYGESSSEGLIVSITLLRELRQSVQIARRNLISLAPRDGRIRSRAIFFEQPINQSRWLEAQIDADLAYLSAAHERTGEVSRLANLRLEHAKEANAHRQHRMDLVQAISLGALLICLDAMHAFETKLPLPERFQWPLIAVLMAIAFVLPPALVHWKDRYGKLEYIGSVLLGCAGAWLAVTGLNPWLASVPGGYLWKWPGILVVVLLFPALMRFVERLAGDRKRGPVSSAAKRR
jgi:hypothetical protein